MINTKLYSDFCFLEISFSKFHYTDNRIGSPYHYFAYMEKGSAKIVSKNKTIFIEEGDLFYIPKNTSYQSYWYGNEEISFFSYGANNLFSSDTASLDLQVIKCPQKTALHLTSIPKGGTDISTKDIGSFFSAVSLLLPYMEKEALSHSNDVLKDVKKHLTINPHYSNDELSRMCGISLPYLYKIFKSIENETPNTCRQKVLCNRAKDLLRTTDLSIEQISSMLGFCSSGYFREIFKKHTKMTPREFRRLYSF